MSEDMHRDVAAYVLGALDAEDREAFETHLLDCDRCKADVVEMAALPGLLSRIDVVEFESSSVHDAAATVVSARNHVGRLERSRRRWQLAATALASAAAVLVVAVVLLVGNSDEPQFPSGEPVELVLASNSSIEGRVALTDQGWGSRVEINLTGLSTDVGYEIWAVGDDGSWQLAASFGPTGECTCRVVGATSLHRSELAQVVLTTSNRAEELLWAWEE